MSKIKEYQSGGGGATNISCFKMMHKCKVTGIIFKKPFLPVCERRELASFLIVLFMCSVYKHLYEMSLSISVSIYYFFHFKRQAIPCLWQYTFVLIHYLPSKEKCYAFCLSGTGDHWTLGVWKTWGPLKVHVEKGTWYCQDTESLKAKSHWNDECRLLTAGWESRVVAAEHKNQGKFESTCTSLKSYLLGEELVCGRYCTNITCPSLK